MAFQIIDDTLDVIGDLNNTGKKVGLDILEGKPTLPTIFAMKDPQYGKRIVEIFTEDEVAEKDAAEAIELIKKTDSIERCRALASAYAERAKAVIAGLPASVYKDSLVSLVDYILSRDR
jgi:geranylgeranyl pyrophosphate synthase